MASPSTPIETHASHAVIYEWRIKRKIDANRKFSTYLHVRVERDGSWDVGEPAPTYFEFIDGIWDEWNAPFMASYQTAFLLDSLRVSEVTDYTIVAGQPAPTYGEFYEMTNFTGIAGPTFGQGGPGNPYLPDYVQIFILKQADASPRNVVGSIRMGPVQEDWTITTGNRLEDSTQAAFQANINDLLTPRAITAADGGNIINCSIVIMRKTPAVGTAAPWSHVIAPDRYKVRFNVGTQNTRKKVRNTYA